MTAKMTRYFLLNPEDGGTNLMKIVGPGMDVYILTSSDQWEHRPRALKYVMEGEAPEVSLDEAINHFKRISGGKKWLP